MKKIELANLIGEYIVKNNCTVREAAKYFGISKSYVHKIISTQLNPASMLYKQCRNVLEKNLAERHIRGGEATKIKYKKFLLTT